MLKEYGRGLDFVLCCKVLTCMMLHTCRPTSTAKNAIVATHDLRYCCKIGQLLHIPCPFSTRHSSQMRSGYLECSVLARDIVVYCPVISVLCVYLSSGNFTQRLFDYLLWLVKPTFNGACFCRADLCRTTFCRAC